MRWEELFADLEAQLDHELSLEQRELDGEAEQLRRARLSLSDRLAELSHGGRRVRLVLADGQPIDVTIESAGADWVAGEVLQGERARGVVVPLASIAAVRSDDREGGRASTVDDVAPKALAQRLGLAFVARDLCRRRVPVELRTSTGIRHGLVERVGADHLDLAEHEAEVDSGRGARVWVVPFAALQTIWV